MVYQKVQDELPPESLDIVIDSKSSKEKGRNWVEIAVFMRSNK